MDLKEDENSRKCFAFSSSSAIEGANKDLSLEIVEKAMKREAKRKITEDLKGSDWKTVQSSKICLRCGDLGHEMSSCGNDYAPEDLKEIQCYICKSFGHLCCANIVDDGPRKVYCYNCGRLGHTGQGCTFRKRSTMASPTVCYNCFNCGKEVHLARGFTKSAKEPRWRRRSFDETQEYLRRWSG